MTTSFADLGLPARLVEALAADGITETFPVQAATLPDALAGKDLCGRAPTGSGKTLGFGIPMMVRISQAEPTKPTGLVLVPTRELAEQVQRAFVPLGRAQWRFIQAIYGGASFGPQIHSLRKGASVIVATPGRLLDIIDKGYCDLSAVEVCVVDEADRMADLGFMPDVRKILDMTPGTRQTMLWSATLDGDVNELIRDYMNDPVRHDLLDDVDQAPVEHKFVVTRPTERLDSAVALIEEHGPTIVFVKTRFGVDDVAEDLNRAGVKAGALHGARSQAVRQRVLEDFKRGRLQALVATDVAARGIHVDNVSLVLHYDMPDNDKDYTHRSGRTGRAGNAGLVIAFVPPSRQRIARQMDGAVGPDIVWEHGETPVERVPAGERETGNRDRGPRDPRGGYGDRDARGGYTDRNDRNGYRGNGYRGNDRPSYGADRQSSGADRPYSGRPPSGDRPSYGARPTYGARPSSGDRPSYGDRSSSGARPPYDSRPAQGSDRGGVRSKNDGPSYGTDRADRGGSRANDAAGRGSRDSRGGADRGHNNFTPRPPRADTPPRDRNDWSPRPRRDDDRGSVGGRFTREDRPAGARNDDRQGRDRPALRADDRSPTGRPGADHGGYRGTNDRSGSDRPRGDRPSYGGGERPRSSSERQGTSRPGNDWAGNDRASTNRPGNNRPGNNRPGTNRAGGGRRDGRTHDDRPWRNRDDVTAKANDRSTDKLRDDRPDSAGVGGPGSQGAATKGAAPRGVSSRPGGRTTGFKPGGSKTTSGRTGGFRSAPGGRPRRDAR